MTEQHFITREIGIDCGHRVTYHGSKCRNLHGHRYTVQATCTGPLFTEGEQQGMVLDFGFLKEEMMSVIDANCDHGMVLWVDDPLLQHFAPPAFLAWPEEWISKVREHLATHPNEGYLDPTGAMGKIYVIDMVPTAENLARHWFKLLEPRVKARTDGQASIHNVKVWETPNCSAQYPSQK